MSVEVFPDKPHLESSRMYLMTTWCCKVGRCRFLNHLSSSELRLVTHRSETCSKDWIRPLARHILYHLWHLCRFYPPNFRKKSYLNPLLNSCHHDEKGKPKNKWTDLTMVPPIPRYSSVPGFPSVLTSLGYAQLLRSNRSRGCGLMDGGWDGGCNFFQANNVKVKIVPEHLMPEDGVFHSWKVLTMIAQTWHLWSWKQFEFGFTGAHTVFLWWMQMVANVQKIFHQQETKISLNYLKMRCVRSHRHPFRRLCQPLELLTPLPLRLLASNWTPAVWVVLKLMWDIGFSSNNLRKYTVSPSWINPIGFNVTEMYLFRNIYETNCV